jgi:predicted alpha-1,6-mannanase (GH76 family)
MRYRVDTRTGYVSFDFADEEKARALYTEEGIRLRVCRDIFDEGVVIDGAPIFATRWANA